MMFSTIGPKPKRSESRSTSFFAFFLSFSTSGFSLVDTRPSWPSMSESFLFTSPIALSSVTPSANSMSRAEISMKPGRSS